MSDDPFTMVHKALWDLVNRHPDVHSLVALGNRVRFDDGADRSPIKDKIQSADLPELVLASTGCAVAMHATSATTSVTRRYDWLLTTGDMRISSLLYPVEWMLFEALHSWGKVLTLLEYPADSDWHFVKRADVTDVTEGLSDYEKNRGIHGWSSAWSCEVEMHFRLRDMPELLPDDSSSGD